MRCPKFGHADDSTVWFLLRPLYDHITGRGEEGEGEGEKGGGRGEEKKGVQRARPAPAPWAPYRYR